MRRAALLLLTCALTLGAAESDGLPTTAAILAETARSHHEAGRVVQLWWLPMDYWVASARELKRSPEEIDVIRALFKNYIVIAAIDVEAKPGGKIDRLSTSEIVRRSEILVNGDEFAVMREVDPRLQQLAPDLTYVLQASLGAVGPGLRLLPLPNVDRAGRAILTGSGRGELRVRYKASATGAPVEFYWRAPLSALVGQRSCPKDGEPLHASWAYCPWHGVKLPD